MKQVKKATLVCGILAAIWLVLGTLLIVVPMLINKNAGPSPVEVSEYIRLERIQSGSYPYELRGKIKNVSDNTVTISGVGGLKVYFDDSENTSTSDFWFEDNRDIVLDPNEEYNFTNCDYAFTSSFNVNRVIVEIDGKSFALVGSLPNYTLPFGIFSLFVAFIMIICTICSIPAQKRAAARKQAVNNLVSQFGNNSIILSGVVSNKSQEKAEAAKTVGWAIGAFFSAIFLGAGVFHIYQASPKRDFILSDDALYILDPTSRDVSQNIQKATKTEFTAASITAGKKKITMKGTDGKTYFNFNLKDCPVSSDELVARLNNIFVTGVNVDTAESAPLTEPTDNVFAEFATAPAVDEAATTENADGKIDLDKTLETESNVTATGENEQNDGE